MKGLNNQVWVTAALTDDNVGDALTLCASLKQTFTNRRVVVIVSSKVSFRYREALHHGFDFVFFLEEDHNTAGLELEDFAKLFAFTLKSFDKCVFLPSTMFAVKNGDHIFDLGKKASALVYIRGEASSIFVLQPNWTCFSGVMNALQARNGFTVDSFLTNWSRKQKKVCVIKKNKFTRGISLNRSRVTGNEKNICFIHMLENPNKLIEFGHKFGEYDETVLKQWASVHGMVSKSLQASPSLELAATTETFRNEPIAIVGMSCRFPGANNLEEYWNLLFAGEDGTGSPPPFRWLREQCSHYKPECRNVNAGFLKVPVDEFDAKFFGISPKEMLFMDPQHRLMHELVWEGLEDAAINPEGLKGSNTGVFMGSWTNDYRDILAASGNGEFFRTYMGNSIGTLAARISHLLEWTGPSVATESGCSSAMVAVHMACRSLQKEESNVALACGVNLLLHPFDKDQMPMVLSPDGHCKTFDANANGFARAEGCAVLVLKRLSDAVKNGDNVWGLIRGTGMSQEGVSKSMGTPTVHGESLAMIQALNDADVDPVEVTYVETHGTGTTVGDPMEVAAIAKAYHTEDRVQPLIIGSVKTNVGHTESVSGIAGIMKVILGMHNELIPAHINFQTLNPAIDLAAVPAVIAVKAVEWKKVNGHPRIAGVSSFGITGTDAHAIIQEPPQLPQPNVILPNTSRPLQILKIATKTQEALDALLEKYQTYLSTTAHSLEDITHTANTSRSNFNHRAIFIGSSPKEVANMISTGKSISGEVSDIQGKICFLFTGQGSQYPDMGKELYASSPVFRMHFDYCVNHLKSQFNVNIMDVLWTSKSAEIGRTIYSQTSIFCVEYALLKLWESWGIKPDYALGHSLGEFTAAVCANIISVDDALKLVAERSRLIDQLPRGKMLVIKATKKTVDESLYQFAGGDKNKILDCAAINSSEQTVVAGDSQTVEEFAQFCENNKVKCIVLESTHAFHSKHMDPILAEYEQIAESVFKLGGNSCKYISGMKGTEIDCDDVNASYWVGHTREKVQFLNASKQAVELGCTTFLEVGPQPVLSALTMMNNSSPITCLPSLKRDSSDWSVILNSVGKMYVKGISIDWAGMDDFCSRTKVPLPHYPFIGKKFWPDMNVVGGATIHPLLGSPMPNASSTKLFQSSLNLKSLEYIKDHKIEDYIVYPGACYMETMLAAGLATTECTFDSITAPNRPMMIENLKIAAPLALEEGKSSQVQTVVDFNSDATDGDWGGMSISIYHKIAAETDPNKWILHASGTYTPIATSADQYEGCTSGEELRRILATPPQDDDYMTNMYARAASNGLKFGPLFQSCEKIWRGEDNSSLTGKIKYSCMQADSNQYILHPIVIDAIFQGLMFWKFEDVIKRKLCVPLAVNKFIWFSKIDFNDLYLHGFELPQGDTTVTSVVLMDSTGKIGALLSGFTFAETTARTVEAVLENQTNSMPEIWEEVWRAEQGPYQHAVNLTEERELTPEEVNHVCTTYGKFSPELGKTYKLLEEMGYLSMLRSLQECGWKPVLHEVIDEEVLFKTLGIKSEFRKYFSFFFYVFQVNGIVAKGQSPGKWVLVQEPKGVDEINAILATPDMTTFLVNNLRVSLLFQKVAETMTRILQGKESPLKVLFPDEKSELPTMTDFYIEYSNSFGIMPVASHVCNERFKNICNARKQQPDGEKTVLRVLEVGAGTGSFSNHALNFLEKYGMPYEYTYTDISSAFFAEAETTFEKFRGNMKFRKLNLEEDPLAQGYSPGYFDYVLACEVLHATKYINQTLHTLNVLMKPGAKFDFIETTSPNINTTFLFGMIDGYWLFQDFELRPNHCTLLSHQWEQELSKTGFKVLNIFGSLGGLHSTICGTKAVDKCIPATKLNMCWLIFCHEDEPICKFLSKKISSLGRHAVVVRFAKEWRQMSPLEYHVRPMHKEDFDKVLALVLSTNWTIDGVLYGSGLNPEVTAQADILQPYFYLIQSLLDLKSCPNIVTLVGGYVPMEVNDLTHFHSSTLVGLSRALRNEFSNVSCRCVDVSMVDPTDETKLMEVVYELWHFDKNSEIVYAAGERYYRKFQKCKTPDTDLKLPAGTDRFQLVLSKTKAIADLTFGSLPIAPLNPDEVEVQVKATSLNFRDVLCVLKPSEYFENKDLIGVDFSGVIKRTGASVTKWSAGDPVYGLNYVGGPLPNHVVVHESTVLAKPSHLTFSEAATLPVVLSTVYHCLVEVAQIAAGDTVLIHTASGGVGLCAIELCKHFGCTIIATAGSKRKQNYLRSIGIQNVFHSRTTAYGGEIMELTRGKGVNVVLNSLTSEGFKEATLSVCAQGARFVEMSKLSVWTVEQVKQLRPDVIYTIADLTTMTIAQTAGIYEKMEEFVNKKILNPIPYVRFDAVNIREALQYLHKAKHIGKICVTMPELRQQGGKMKTYTPMFWDNSTYLITGGLGGIGFEVCKWMVSKGAKNVILGGRSAPNVGIQREIDELNRKGANVIPVQLDVGNYEECRQLIEGRIPALGLPSIRGIMHAAGTLSDGLLVNQNWTKLSSTFNTKIDGTLNLHELTKSSNLEHFVLFSSMAAKFGSPGQSNHSAGNMFEDTFCLYRHSMGLPATTINWGTWGEVGVATEVVLAGVKPLSNLQGLTALEYTLKSQRVQTSVINVESFQLLTRLLPQLTHYIDERFWKAAGSSGQTNMLKTDDFWRQYESAADANERLDWVKDTIRKLLRITLRLDDSDWIDDNISFQELGVDSLMFVEIKNGLQSLLGERVVVDANSVRDCDTVTLLSACLINLIEGNSDDSGPLSEQDVNDLIREDAILPEDITPTSALPAKRIGDVKTVLLTGATGFLGSYVLRDLSQMDQISKIVCLIRPKKNIEVGERLRAGLEAKGILGEINMTKVHCVMGNMAELQLGVDPETYTNLTHNIDAIFNCAAFVSHIEPYKKTKSKSGIRDVNVGGLKHLLHLACTGQLKHVLHSSAMLTVTKVSDDNRLTETWQDTGDFDGVSNLGYPNTKFVQDLLMKQAVDRGIPAKTFRYPFICGDSRTGQFNVEDNHLMLRYLFVIKTNIMPSNPNPLLLVPVNACSDVSLKIFFNEKAPSDVYNVTPNAAFIDQEFIEIAENFGYSVDTVEYSEFAQRIQESTSQDASIALFKEFYKDDIDLLSLYVKVEAVRRWVDGDVAPDFWRSNKLAKFVPTFYSELKHGGEYIKNDLLYAQSKGWF